MVWNSSARWRRRAASSPSVLLAPEMTRAKGRRSERSAYRAAAACETFKIIRQCSSALAYLHGQPTPIAHRDIKPANILLQRRSEVGIFVKPADFGIARHSFELLTLCGTYLYLAPEIHSDTQRGTRKKTRLGYSATVDIWSLGVVAYELPIRSATAYKLVEVRWGHLVRKDYGSSPASYSAQEGQATFSRPAKVYGSDYPVLLRQIRGTVAWVAFVIGENDPTMRGVRRTVLVSDQALQELTRGTRTRTFPYLGG
ncbi:Protein kinase-like domain protein [Akanthomyces lecanii RCEF 1005]|uniref:Protein kinase-like domain protein n=1 Tax=Akanthomyces lecanii RCEF 1005 TaxID=1081108 RepID=A0A162J829_CORDF|nr:Protein kinase-like domain protein [Akanthomyces lecanii RCEF 1005]